MSRDSRARVALVAHGVHDGGGMERAFAELIRHAHTRFDYTVFSAELAPELRQLVTWERVRVPARPIPARMLAFFTRVSVPLARARVDLVHSLGAIAPNRADVITVPYCHAGSRAKTGQLAPTGSPLARRVNTTVARAMAVAAEQFCYRPGRAGVLAGVSPGIIRELEEHYETVRVALTPNGVDIDRFRADEATRAELRASEGATGALICLFVGGDWDRKGLAVAIEALSRAESASPMLLWVVGRGNRRRFEQLASELAVADRVRFFGPRADVERFYQAADVFVLPSEYETFSLVAHEAAACSLPVVATRVSGIEDLVADGESGLLVARSGDAAARALTTLAADPELRARMGREGRRRASLYTWDNAVRSITELYDELLARRGAHTG